MKINKLGLNKVQQQYFKQKKETNKKTRARKDSMEISTEAKEIKKFEEKLKSITEVRKEKVEKIRKAIAKGEYRIDNKVLARKILDRIEQE